MFGPWARTILLVAVGIVAFSIRLHAVFTYGRVIHEFDPWFNYRATEYLVNNGPAKFFSWYDEESWYPLGRPVGTTIYPGLQFTAWFLYWLSGALGFNHSLNDVCVFIPAIFSVFTCFFTYLLTLEVSGPNAAVVASCIMAITPSHIMRSVAGGYDNESIAVMAIVSTFYLWIRSLRTPASWPVGILAAISYTYMVGAWGGYIFVLNMIGIHALFMTLLWHTSGLHKAYSLFYLLGTLGAVQFPVVGLAPLRSLEQLGPMAVFGLLQVIEGCTQYRRYRLTRSKKPMTDAEFQVLVVKALACCGAAFAVLCALFLPTGYLGPLSARVRGLFIRHTKTGNPLVDSVAEHQATRPEMYYAYFHMVCFVGPIGWFSMWFERTPAKLFLILYALITYYFSQKMVRLVLVLAPASSILGGIGLTIVVEWSLGQIQAFLQEQSNHRDGGGADSGSEGGGRPRSKKSPHNKAMQRKKEARGGGQDDTNPITLGLQQVYDESPGLRQVAALAIIYLAFRNTWFFLHHSMRMAASLSNPSIMIRARLRGGGYMMIDDFREAYWWLRDETPSDARIMAWWDYGYQISGIGNRTTLADGNTWNHEHIALLGKALVSPVPESHKIVKHLADYVLVWSTHHGGMPGDDVAKSPHMARISGSVYKDIDASKFYMDRGTGKPSLMMEQSLVYNLVNYRLDPNASKTYILPLAENKMEGEEEEEGASDGDTSSEYLYQEVYTTKNDMVRIYKVLHVSQESKAYCKEGRGYKAWYEGRPGGLIEAYPPGIQRILAEKQDFEQLEDFNRKK